VTLGIGMPTWVANHIPAGMEVVLPSENGILGMGAAPAAGAADFDRINASKQTWVMMDLLTKKGESKVVTQCTYPLTGIGCVKRIYSELATLECTSDGLKLIDKVEGLAHAELETLVGLPIAA
jgi:3-oxoadipate CoA-transferase beta subunit